MSEIQDSIPSVDIDKWVEASASAPAEHEIRQVMRAILYAIGSCDSLREGMMIKGGVLLALKYGTGRHTKDVDFSTKVRVQDFDIDGFISLFKESLESVLADMDSDIDCRYQTHEQKPPRPDASFPTLRIKVGYARRGSRQHKALMRQAASKVVCIDYSFNEITYHADRFHLDKTGDFGLVAYSLVDQVAEKFRAMIQQTTGRRARVRRQDAYDIYAVLNQGYLQSNDEKESVRLVLLKKCEARELTVSRDTILEEEIRERSEKEFAQLADELEVALPEFDVVFGCVVTYYLSLPWGAKLTMNKPK